MCLDMFVQTCSQERIAVENDSDITAVDVEKDRWYVKLESGNGSDDSPSNDISSDCDSKDSSASAVGQPAKLPSGILGQKKESTERCKVEQLKHLFDNARRRAMSAKAEKAEEDQQVLEHANEFKKRLKSSAKTEPKQ